MTSGSLVLDNEGDGFGCGHQHGEGDRCVSFWYEADYFERLAADAGAHRRSAAFAVPRLPPLPTLSPLVARAGAGAIGAGVPWEELAVTLATSTVKAVAGVPSNHD